MHFDTHFEGSLFIMLSLILILRNRYETNRLSNKEVRKYEF